MAFSVGQSLDVKIYHCDRGRKWTSPCGPAQACTGQAKARIDGARMRVYLVPHCCEGQRRERGAPLPLLGEMRTWADSEWGGKEGGRILNRRRRGTWGTFRSQGLSGPIPNPRGLKGGSAWPRSTPTQWLPLPSSILLGSSPLRWQLRIVPLRRRRRRRKEERAAFDKVAILDLGRRNQDGSVLSGYSDTQSW